MATRRRFIRPFFFFFNIIRIIDIVLTVYVYPPNDGLNRISIVSLCGYSISDFIRVLYVFGSFILDV